MYYLYFFLVFSLVVSVKCDNQNCLLYINFIKDHNMYLRANRDNYNSTTSDKVIATIDTRLDDVVLVDFKESFKSRYDRIDKQGVQIKLEIMNFLNKLTSWLSMEKNDIIYEPYMWKISDIGSGRVTIVNRHHILCIRRQATQFWKTQLVLKPMHDKNISPLCTWYLELVEKQNGAFTIRSMLFDPNTFSLGEYVYVSSVPIFGLSRSIQLSRVDNIQNLSEIRQSNILFKLYCLPNKIN